MTKIIINNHFSHALEWIEKNQAASCEIHFCPIIKDKTQENFFKLRYENLKSHIPQLLYTPKSSINQLDESKHLFCRNAYYEINRVQADKKHTGLNQLFKTSDINFKIPHSFTKFRNLVEKKLPRTFTDAIEPYDQEVKDHIQYYFYETELASNYFQTRNGMLESDDSTRFSKWLACGALDVKYLYNEVKKYEKRVKKNKSTYWIIFELLWREFFYWHYQEYKTAYFNKYGLEAQHDFSSFDLIDINKLKEQYSSNPFILASIRELEQTGFQSNRTRQIFASFLVLCTPYTWRQGAELFERYLIDYDVFSNWGNWMYLSGYGVDSRGPRFFYIPKQMKNYDSDLSYIKFWCPELNDTPRNEILRLCEHTQL